MPSGVNNRFLIKDVNKPLLGQTVPGAEAEPQNPYVISTLALTGTDSVVGQFSYKRTIHVIADLALSTLDEMKEGQVILRVYLDEDDKAGVEVIPAHPVDIGYEDGDAILTYEFEDGEDAEVFAQLLAGMLEKTYPQLQVVQENEL